MAEDQTYTVKTDHDLPTTARTWGNSWKVMTMEYMHELQKAGKGIRRLKNKLHRAWSVKQEPLAEIAAMIAHNVHGGKWAKLSLTDLTLIIRNYLMSVTSMNTVLKYYYPARRGKELAAIVNKLAGRSVGAFDEFDSEMAKLIRRAQAVVDRSEGGD